MTDNSGAIPALRGYRKQFLYSLGRIIHGCNEVYCPEKLEDLSIYDNDGKLLELIQVKDYASPLTFSDLELFLVRATKVIGEHPHVKVVLATFGPLGKELEGVLKDKKVDAKPKFHKVRQAIERLEVEYLDEGHEYQKSLRFLSDQPTISGDTYSAFDILMQSLYRGSENSQSFTKEGVLEHLERIGSYLVGREAHHQEWGTTILPLIDTLGVSEVELRKEFNQGVGARWEHITAGVDSERPQNLKGLQDRFRKNRIVIVHGASGQGKSSLAYRFLRDYCSTTTRYEIRDISTPERALKIAAALRGYGSSLPVPLTFYADVSHADKGVEELIKQVADMQHIRLLLTIREEDWRLISLSRADLSFEEVELGFNESEAQQIFDAVENNFPDFSQAWAKFGGDGPLLEFVYLLNHTETLRERLTKQYHQIADGNHSEDLDVLDIVAIAGSCGARIDLQKFKMTVSPSSLKRVIDRLEREYLIREGGNGIWLSGLHPIRSSILAEICIDPVIKNWKDMAEKSLPLILDEDLEVFLLNVFAFHREIEGAITPYLQSLNLASWKAAGGIMRALLWKGIDGYIQNHRELIEEAQKEVGEGVWILLDFDFSNLKTGSDHWNDFAPLISPERQEQIKQWQAQQGSKAEAFHEFTEWIGASSFPTKPCEDESDWRALGEIAYWASKTKQADKIFERLDWDVIAKTADKLPLETLGTFIFGTWHAFSSHSEFLKWYEEIKPILVSRYKTETLTPTLEIDGEIIRAHFIVSIDPNEEEGQPDATQNILHQKALEHVELLSQLFPGYEKYGCQGYGHMLFDFMEFDETTKSGISPAYLRPDWVVQINKTARILCGHKSRPSTWREYCDQVVSIRQEIVQLLSELRLNLSKHFRSKKVVQQLVSLPQSEQWERVAMCASRFPSLPLEALDPWGISDEKEKKANSNDNSNGLDKARFTAHLQRYKKLLKYQAELFRGVSNFLQQIPATIVINSNLGRNAKTEDERALIKGIAKQNGYDDTVSLLPSHNLSDSIRTLPEFQRLYRMHFSGLSNLSLLNKLEQEEEQVLLTVWCLWFFFTTSPYNHWNSPGKAAISQLNKEEEASRNAIEKVLQKASSNELSFQYSLNSPLYENEPALWITIDGMNPVEVYGQFEGLYGQLQDALRETKSGTLKAFAIQFLFSNLVIVPLVGGKLLEPWAWILPAFKFTPNVEENRSLSALNLMLRPIDEELISQAGLELWKHPKVTSAMLFYKSVATINTQLMHLVQIAKVPNIDEEGRRIIKSYFAKFQQNTDEHMQQVFDTGEILHNQFEENHSQSSDDNACLYLDDAISLLSSIHEKLRPPNFKDGRAELSVEKMEVWQKELESIMGEAFTISILWASHHIFQPDKD